MLYMTEMSEMEDREKLGDVLFCCFNSFHILRLENAWLGICYCAIYWPLRQLANLPKFSPVHGAT